MDRQPAHVHGHLAPELVGTQPGQIFWDIWGRDAADIHAVGPSSMVYRFDGIRWEPQETPQSASSIWGVGTHELYTVDHATGALMRYR